MQQILPLVISQAATHEGRQISMHFPCGQGLPAHADWGHRRGIIGQPKKTACEIVNNKFCE